MTTDNPQARPPEYGAANGSVVTRRLLREIHEQATRHRRGSSLKRHLMQDLLIIESIAIRALGHRPNVKRETRREAT